MKLLSSTLFCLSVFSVELCSAQGWLTTVDYSRLKTELGGALETGAGVEVALAEADLNSTASIRQFLPDSANSAFAGKTLINASVNSNFTDTVSSHATIVGGLIAGRVDSTLVPGVLRISTFDAADWLLVRSGFGTINPPSPNPYLIHNHSYIANGFTVAQAEEASARFDFWMDRDGTLSTVGANNGLSSNLPQLLQQTHNAISVGRSNGLHSCGFTTLNGAGRIKPEIVAPGSTTSEATPMVGSAAALLQARANTIGATDASLPQVKKAILLAGATKTEFPEWDQTVNSQGIVVRPLDNVFGAGELNIYNSYHILSGQEWGGDLDTAPVTSGPRRAWDYGESLFPGEEMFWNIEVPEGQIASEVSILLTWHARYSDAAGNFVNSRTLPNMRLRLWSSTKSFQHKLLRESNSPVDNIEHIYLNNLGSGVYTIGVTTDINTDFAVAWRFDPMQNFPMPRVASVNFGDGSNQRSMVKTTSIVFNSLMDVDDGAVSVTRRGVGGGPVTSSSSISVVDGKTVLSLTFSGAMTRGTGILNDGNYQIEIDASKVRRTGTSLSLDGDGDGLVGGNYVLGTASQDGLFAYFGDTNGDRNVSTSEFNDFRSSFGKSVGSPGFNILFDFDANGVIGTTDFNAFRARFGKVLPFE